MVFFLECCSLLAALLLAGRAETGQSDLRAAGRAESRYIEVCGLGGDAATTLFLLSVSKLRFIEVRLRNVVLTQAVMDNLVRLDELKGIRFIRCEASIQQLAKVIELLPTIETVTIKGTPSVTPNQRAGIVKHVRFLVAIDVKAEVLADLLKSFHSLERFSLRSTRLDDVGMNSILAQVASLKRLEIVDCKLSAGAFGRLSESKLSSLLIQNTNLTPSEVASVCGIKSLKHLAIVDVKLVDGGLAILARAELTSLHLSRCGVNSKNAARYKFAAKNVHFD